MSPDWTTIQSASYGTDNSFTLTDDQVKLLLFLIQKSGSKRYQWVVSGSSPTDAEWDDIEAFVAALEDKLMSTKPVFSVTKNADQAIQSSTWTKITWQTEQIDSHGQFASNRFTVSEAGRYLIVAVVHVGYWPASPTGTCTAWIRLNNTSYLASMIFDQPRSISAVTLSVIADLDQDDYVEVYVYQDSGSTRYAVAQLSDPNDVCKFYGFQL